MTTQLKKDFFINNRQALKRLVGDKLPIVLAADVLIQQYSDTAFPFRQNSNFYYLTGINEPSFILVMDHDRDYLILPPPAVYLDIENGKIDLGLLRERSGIDNFFDSVEGWQLLEKRLNQTKTVSTLPEPPEYIEDFGFYTNPTRSVLVKKLKSLSSDVQLNNIVESLIELRSIKQPEELKAIQAAIDITIKGFEQTRLALNELTNESEIDSLFYSLYKKSDSSPAFTSVIAGGKNACAIHYRKNNAKLNKTDLIVVDAGAEVEHYSADISRTYGLKPTKRAKAVFDSVKEAQNYAIAQLKPGVLYEEYENKVRAFMTKKLAELKLIKNGDVAASKIYFPHLTSHSLGLDTHDIWNRDMVIKENMVLTVEPGIYIPEEGIGVRLEDDILITKGGAKNLSQGLANLIN